VRVALCISLFILYILLISIIVVTVLFICCSVKLFLSRLTSFLPFSFHSPPHLSGGRGNRVTVWPFVASHGQIKVFITGPQMWGRENGKAEQNVLKKLCYNLLYAFIVVVK